MVGQFLEEQKGQRLRVLPAQGRGILVDLVIELLGSSEINPFYLSLLGPMVRRCADGSSEHPLAGDIADRGIPGQRSGDGRLRDPRQRRDVERGRPPLSHRDEVLAC
jgi:hypothetical protein